MLRSGKASVLARLGLPLLAACPNAEAQQAQAELNPVVVTVTRTEKPAFDVPASIDALGREQLQDNLRINLSESLARVPGLVVQNRQNYAQDLQISSRGFGARSAFGVRGLRLYADGIPATMPDGQGQVSHFDLASAARIEVLRGPFSVLYGNSSGGVISLFTEDGGPEAIAEFSGVVGSDGIRRGGLKLSGQEGRARYVLSASQFQTDGYRVHSAAQRATFNGKLRFDASIDTKITLVLNRVAMPDVQDPLGLTRAQFDSDPRAASPVALQFDTRKSVGQTQAGAVLEHRLSGADSLQWMVYAGSRATTQFQAIPVATQLPPTHPGGVIDLERSYRGTDLRWTHRGRLLGTPAMWTAGIAADRLGEDRRGFQNFSGATLGVQGALRRDEGNSVRNFDQYVQGEWEAAERWSISAGLRRSRVAFRSSDRYLVNGDDSGAISYSALTPVAGLVFHARDELNLYAAFGSGFETPTFNELAYQPSGAGGLNFGLQAARSRQWELGAKWRFDGGWLANAALFRAGTRDEIVVQTNSGGRTTFQNAGRTERRGFEMSVAGKLSGGLSAYAAATLLDARYRDGFLTCTAAPCAAPSVAIPAGNRMPGIPRASLYAELAWRHAGSGFESALELRQVAKVFVDDRNSDAAPGYAVANLRLAWRQVAGRWTLREFLRIDNLAGRQYAGSVIVNEGNSRFFEPAPGRNWLIGMNAGYRFD